MITRYSPEQVNQRLDKIEARLPKLPATIFRLQRSIGERVFSTTTDIANTLSRSLGRTGNTGETAAKTVFGTARWSASKAAEETATGVRRVVGQGKAQSKITRERVSREASRVARKAGEAVTDARDTVVDAIDAAEDVVSDTDDTAGKAYEAWTKGELYERAQELDLDGRSTMSKKQLITALRKAA